MTILTDAGHIIFMVTMVLFGVSGNMFNLVLTIEQQVKTRIIQTVGLILCVISISNIVLVLAAFTMVVTLFLQPDLWCEKPYPLYIRTVVYLLLNFSCISFWAIAWLSLFYCVKVVSFSSECLGSLKRNISTVINTAVLLSCLGFSLFFLPMFSLERVDSSQDSNNISKNINLNGTSNIICQIPGFSVEIESVSYTVAVLSCLCPIPLMIMLPTSLRMVIHLCAHTLALQKNKTQVQGSDSYLLVCKLTISLVGVYLTSLFIVALSIIIRIIGPFITYLVLIFGYSFYSTMTSVLLMASNRYLKEKLWSLFCCREAKEQATKSQTVETRDI
ncbi:taste receptor type 2 member 40-like [Xyrauchen texanus]|uniref:taste receptor type 2 member 40-like n=1 Tax=Xyrauchen texanus TaxID=154827 RepID=UPI0022425D69|nr:taste receptor type 2 member 40-like [Xyrauchen texanus]